MQNIGKIFESEFKKSIPKEYWYYRFNDNSSSFGGGENTRFTTHNICDCEVVGNEYLFLLELKSHKGTSIPFSCIRDKQIKEMAEVCHKRIKPYFIFNFREKEKTYAIESQKIKSFIDAAERKSFPLAWCEENGIEIGSQKKKVRYNYSLKEFFEGIENN